MPPPITSSAAVTQIDSSPARTHRPTVVLPDPGGEFPVPGVGVHEPEPFEPSQHGLDTPCRRCFLPERLSLGAKAGTGHRALSPGSRVSVPAARRPRRTRRADLELFFRNRSDPDFRESFQLNHGVSNHGP